MRGWLCDSSRARKLVDEDSQRSGQFAVGSAAGGLLTTPVQPSPRGRGAGHSWLLATGHRDGCLEGSEESKHHVGVVDRGVFEELDEFPPQDIGRVVGHALGFYQRCCPTTLIPLLQPDLDAGHDLEPSAQLEIEDQCPRLIIHALLELVEEVGHRRHEDTAMRFTIEASMDRLPDCRPLWTKGFGFSCHCTRFLRDCPPGKCGRRGGATPTATPGSRLPPERPRAGKEAKPTGATFCFASSPVAPGLARAWCTCCVSSTRLRLVGCCTRQPALVGFEVVGPTPPLAAPLTRRCGRFRVSDPPGWPSSWPSSGGRARRAGCQVSRAGRAAPSHDHRRRPSPLVLYVAGLTRPIPPEECPSAPRAACYLHSGSARWRFGWR